MMKVKVSYISSLIFAVLVLLGAYYVIAGINNVTLDSPVNGFNTTNTSTVTFQCTAAPNGTENVSNISLGFNFTGGPIGLGIGSNGSIVVNTTQSLLNGTNTSVFAIARLPEGIFSWSCLGANYSAVNVTANRSFDKIQEFNNVTLNGSAKAADTNRTVIVDTIRPNNITLVFPSGTTVPQRATGANSNLSNLTDAHFTNGSVTVVWRMHDNGMTTSLCNVTVNGVVRASNIAGYSNTVSGNTTEVDNSQNTSATVLGFSSLITTNTWFVNCTDYVGNANSSNFSGTVTITDTVAPTINGIDQKLKFKGTVHGQQNVEGTQFDYGTPVDILGCNGTENVDYFSTNATIYLKRPDNSGFSLMVNDTGGIEKFTVTDTKALGFYDVNCTIIDGSGNQNSTAKTFEIVRTAARSNFFATTEGFRQPISTGSKRDFGELSTNGIKTRISESGSFLFQIDGQSHEVLVKEINGDTITIVVQSEPVTATIKAGESKSFDVNNDGTNDIGVSLEAITSSNRADITFTRVSTPAPQTSTTPEPSTRPSTPILTREEAGSLLKILVVVFVILLIVYFFIRVKKKPSSKLQFNRRDLGAYRDTTLQLYYK